MLKYAVQTGKMNEVMELLFRVLDMRITFFDLQACEVEDFHIKEASLFCRIRRQNAKFNTRCVKCDQEHLLNAKQTGRIHIYHCHAGLLEGIIPLYDRHRIYLGAIVFGQLRDRAMDYGDMDDADRRLLSKSRKSSEREMHDIGVLLKYISEYICENEIIKYSSKPWVEKLDAYICEHLDERLTLTRLAAKIGRSTSFLSHNFPLEFGLPLKEHIRQERMKRAKERLQDGRAIKETAMELGFYDEFHFSREFKRYFGQPPSTFKPQ